MTTPLTAGMRVRMLPAPACDPPLAQDQEPHWTPAQPMLQIPAAPPPPPAPPSPPAAAPSPADPATRTAAVRFVHTCLEILNGYRPVTHLRALSHPLAAPQVLEAMTYATRRLSRAAGVASRPAVASGDPSRARVHLRRMRVCQPRAGIAEISAVIGTSAQARCGLRCWAVAFRLEHLGGRWQCTVARML